MWHLFQLFPMRSECLLSGVRVVVRGGACSGHIMLCVDKCFVSLHEAAPVSVVLL